MTHSNLVRFFKFLRKKFLDKEKNPNDLEKLKESRKKLQLNDSDFDTESRSIAVKKLNDLTDFKQEV